VRGWLTSWTQVVADAGAAPDLEAVWMVEDTGQAAIASGLSYWKRRLKP